MNIPFKNLFLITAFSTLVGGAYSYAAVDFDVTVNKNGRLVRADDNSELRFYGSNYTLPFAHAYRAVGELGVDRKSAIDKDVYHLSRMGINAFRLHLWDVELSDSVGNLLENDHLDLLDYLIAQLEKRGIAIVITAQTNFGNGYPEKNIDTGAYSYDFDKCDIHENPEAIAAQRNYVNSLAKHFNPYTGKSYADDKAIIALEINNEPCHKSSPQQVTDYIDTMALAIKEAGWSKPILYNVSHNMDMVPGYFDADIDGTTYQWYPVGLVAGHEQKGNFLPYLDKYTIPFDTVRNFDSKAKFVYEFDPADVLDSYLFPAVARTFAREGFQWATQFAYDPIDIARFNTEYQTHYLNLAYTPQKALGMRIAAHVMANTPVGADYGAFPADSVFGDVSLSYNQNLALLNSPEEYVYTNSTSVPPVSPESLVSVAGYGSSPVVKYAGKGMYMLDKVADGVWRLEVLPDVLFSGDPFAKPSLKREVAHILPNSHPIELRLPGISDNFFFKGVNNGNTREGQAQNSSFEVSPGVYLLASSRKLLDSIGADTPLGNINIGEFVMPPVSFTPLHVNHKAEPLHYSGSPLIIEAEAFGSIAPDSLIVYPADASFWRDDNKLYGMRRTGPYTFEVEIPSEDLHGTFDYRIVALSDSIVRTFPSDIDGAPLDWDAPVSEVYSTRIIKPDDRIVLVNASDGFEELAVSTIPDVWDAVMVRADERMPFAPDVLSVNFKPGDDVSNVVLTKFVGDIISPLSDSLVASDVVVNVGDVNGLDRAIVTLVNSDGVSFSKEISLSDNSSIKVPLDSLVLSPTLLCPAPFPTFLDREIMPVDYTKPLRVGEVEKIQLVFSPSDSSKESSADIIGVWLE